MLYLQICTHQRDSVKGLPNLIASATFINMASSKHILITDKLCSLISGYHITI